MNGPQTPPPGAGAEPGSAQPAQGEPFPAPLPVTRHHDRPGVWVEPGARLPRHQAEGLPALGELPPLPGPLRKRGRGLLYSFLLLVLLPAVLIGAYFTLLADDEYFAEFRFSVTQGTPVLPGTSPVGGAPVASGALSGLAAVLGAPSGSGPASQNFIVTDYLNSAQAVQDLQQRIDLRSFYARPQISWWQRLDASQPLEAFVSYFHHYARADYDQVTGLATASVRAFTPQDAQTIAQALASLSENLVNDINSRAYRDAINSAEVEVKKAQERMREVDSRMHGFRTREGVINPGNSVVSTNVQLEQQLQNSLVNLQTQLAAQGVSDMDTQNGPTAKLLRAQIAATRQQLAAVEGRIGHDANGSRALADVVGRYEELNLEQQYAQNMLVQTMQALDIARANAVAQHLYIVPYVSPTLPQSATYPRRGLDTLLGALICFGLWLGGLMILRAIQDHAL